MTSATETVKLRPGWAPDWLHQLQCLGLQSWGFGFLAQRLQSPCLLGCLLSQISLQHDLAAAVLRLQDSCVTTLLHTDTCDALDAMMWLLTHLLVFPSDSSFFLALLRVTGWLDVQIASMTTPCLLLVRKIISRNIKLSAQTCHVQCAFILTLIRYTFYSGFGDDYGGVMGCIWESKRGLTTVDKSLCSGPCLPWS